MFWTYWAERYAECHLTCYSKRQSHSADRLAAQFPHHFTKPRPESSLPDYYRRRLDYHRRRLHNDARLVIHRRIATMPWAA